MLGFGKRNPPAELEEQPSPFEQNGRVTESLNRLVQPHKRLRQLPDLLQRGHGIALARQPERVGYFELFLQRIQQLNRVINLAT